MVDRVLNTGGVSAAMRVSLPGYDVKTANLSQMAFDARFANLEVYRKGAVSIAGSNAVNSFSFGETLSAAPNGLFVFNVFNPGDGVLRGQAPFIVRTIVGSADTISDAYAAVTASGMTLQWWATGSGIVVYYVLYRQLTA